MLRRWKSKIIEIKYWYLGFSSCGLQGTKCMTDYHQLQPSTSRVWLQFMTHTSSTELQSVWAGLSVKRSVVMNWTQAKNCKLFILLSAQIVSILTFYPSLSLPEDSLLRKAKADMEISCHGMENCLCQQGFHEAYCWAHKRWIGCHSRLSLQGKLLSPLSSTISIPIQSY